MRQRNVLLVSYHFPPMGGSGVQRALKLAKYLPDAGWQAHVLCAGHTHLPLLDVSLVDELVGRAAVHPVCGWEAGALARTLCGHLRTGPSGGKRLGEIEDRLYWRLHGWIARLGLPEQELLWAPAAIRRARELIPRRSIGAVVTSSPPLSCHLVGWSLARRMGLPWIADLRDPIVDNFAAQDARGPERLFRRWIEGLAVRNARRLVVTCPELADRLAARYPDVPVGRFATITNGFDPGDAPAPAARTVGERFVLAYIGSFYRQQSIAPILEAVRLLRVRRPDIGARLELRMVGSLAASQQHHVQADDDAFFRRLGYQPHRTAIAEMASADALLLATPLEHGGRYCIPAKTFEYLAFGGHVIAFVHAGTAASRMLSDAGGCTILRDGSTSEWSGAIETCFDAWQAGTLAHTRRRGAIERFDRLAVAKEYATVINRCVDGSSLIRLGDEEVVDKEAA